MHEVMLTPLSLIVPAFEEADRLPATLEALRGAAAKLEREVELIVVDDGSRDATAAVAKRCGARVVRLPENRGKGAAVSAGVRAACHPLIAFTDADCPYDLESLRPMLAGIEAGQCEIAIGARELSQSQVNRGYGCLRRLSGKAFSLLTWLAIGLPFRDSQCGLKAFRADTARELFAMRTIDGFGFDFEILAAALAVGHRVERFPVRLTHSDDSRIQLVRDSLRMATDLLRVRLALRRCAYDFLPDVAEEHPCPLCGDTDFQPRAAKNGFRMVECGACQLWYLNPMPTEAALKAFYDDDYFASDDSLSGGYADYGERGDDFRDLFGHRLAAIPEDVRRGRILDVGAGFGYLLDAARDSFVETWAVERNATAAARISATGRVVNASFAAAELPEAAFDVVSMQDCFEHLRDPHAALARVSRILAPGGVLMVVTPNTDSLLARVQRGGWVSLKFPEHVALYNPATLRRILAVEGFVVDSMVPAGQYARLDFIASRIFSGYPGLADQARRFVARLGGARRRVWVGSGSLLVVARFSPDSPG